MANNAGLNVWLTKFKESRLGRSALKDLDRYFPPDNEPEQIRMFSLRNMVLGSCYCAAIFDRSNDPNKKARDADARALEALPAQREAIKTLRKFAKTHKRAAAMTFGRAILDLNNSGIKIICAGGETRDVVDILDCILEAYLCRLVAPIPLVAAGPLLSRSVYGCLHYDPPLDDGKHNRLPEVETMLLFDLVQTFRLRSQRIYSRQTGQPMPKEGKPHYALAATFTNAIVGEKRFDGAAASSRLKAFLKANPTVGIGNWPV